MRKNVIPLWTERAASTQAERHKIDKPTDTDRSGGFHHLRKPAPHPLTRYIKLGSLKGLKKGASWWQVWEARLQVAGILAIFGSDLPSLGCHVHAVQHDGA